MPKVTQEHLEKRKAEILAAAERVLNRKGFEPTTMQDIVKESGMSRGGVYQYFSSPEEMLEALHVRNVHETTVFIEHLLEENDTVWGALEAYVHEYDGEEEENEEHSFFGMVMYEYSVISWRNERHRRFMLDYYYEARDTLIDLLKKGIDRGEFRPTQSLETIVNFVINITDGLILQYAIGGEELPPAKEQIEALKIYLRTVLQVEDD